MLLITNGVAIWQIIIRAQKSLEEQLRIKRIDHISQQLSEFYDPLYSMMRANGSVFRNFGPNAFPDDDIRSKSAAENWENLKKRVILPNNQKMVDILRSKSHLMSKSDRIDNYIPLNNHLQFYEVFVESPTELYDKFRFPEGIVDHVEEKREELVAELNELKEL